MQFYPLTIWCAQSLNLVRLFCDPMDCSLPASSVHGLFQARVLEWGAISSSRGFSWPRDGTHVFCIGGWILYHWATREAHSKEKRDQKKWDLNWVAGCTRSGQGQDWTMVSKGLSFWGNKLSWPKSISPVRPRLILHPPWIIDDGKDFQGDEASTSCLNLETSSSSLLRRSPKAKGFFK